jgi:RNA polymerase sigma-70 factor (ECF subfamily)
LAILSDLPVKVSGVSGHSSPLLDDFRSVRVRATSRPDFGGDVAILARCRAGEASAWKAFHDANFDFVYRVARRLGTPTAEIEDVCQDVFLVGFRKLDSFVEGRITTWLYRITERVVSARHRRRRVRSVVLAILAASGIPVASGPQSPEGVLEARETRERVRQILERMSPKKREVFALYELEGLSGEEIAERVGCRIETVWTRLHYARQQFQALARDGALIP